MNDFLQPIGSIGFSLIGLISAFSALFNSPNSLGLIARLLFMARLFCSTVVNNLDRFSETASLDHHLAIHLRSRDFLGMGSLLTVESE
jgi:hypothetical protein